MVSCMCLQLAVHGQIHQEYMERNQQFTGCTWNFAGMEHMNRSSKCFSQKDMSEKAEFIHLLDGYRFHSC